MEVHPFFPQRALRAFCRSQGILTQAYSSLGQSDPTLREHPVVLEIAARRAMTPAQVLLRCVEWMDGWMDGCLSMRLPVQGPRGASIIGYVYVTSAMWRRKVGRPCRASDSSISKRRWALDQGVPVIPKTTQPTRMAENLAALTTCGPLEKEDMAALAGLEQAPGAKKFAWDPEKVV